MKCGRFIATYQYATFSLKSDEHIQSTIEDLITCRAVTFAIDSSYRMYHNDDGKVVAIQLEVKNAVGSFQAIVSDFDELFSDVPRFYQDNIINAIGMSMFEEQFTPGYNENDYILFFYSPIIMNNNGESVYGYPVVKVYRSGVIIIEISVYSSDYYEGLQEREVVDFLLDVHFREFEELLMPVDLLISKGAIPTDKIQIESDGITRDYSIFSDSKINNVRDVALYLVDGLIETSVSFVAHQNYSFDSKLSKNSIKALLNGIPFDSAKSFIAEDPKNYKDFKISYNAYITIGSTVTTEGIYEARVPTLVLNQMFLYLAIIIYYLRARLESEVESLEEVLEVYEWVIKLEGYMINGMNSYRFSRNIMADLFEEYHLTDQLENIKELISIKTNVLQIEKNRKDIISQNYLALLIAFLSSEAIMIYFIRPIYLKISNTELTALTDFQNAILFMLPILLTSLGLLLLGRFKVSD